MIFTDEQQALTRAALAKVDLGELARFMISRQSRAAPSDDTAEFEDLARRSGWIDAESGDLTELGMFICDPLREYLFWVERGRDLPFTGHGLGLMENSLRGKKVLEIGSGSGMNLFSLTEPAAEVVGLEPVDLYRQMCEIIAEREGIDGFSVEPGSAEKLPFSDERFDTVLCVTAHQYFDIERALHEIARVLKPRGELIIIGGTIGKFAMDQLKPAVSSPLQAGKVYLKTMVNTLGYMAWRRRLLMRRSKWTTAHPVYPSRRALQRMIEDANLVMDSPAGSLGEESYWRARKPG